MKKAKIIWICIFAIIMVSLLTYLNYDKLVSFFTNKEWELADSIGQVELNDFLVSVGTNSEMIFIKNNCFEGYTTNLKKNIDISVTSKDVVAYSEGDYAIIAQKSPAEIRVINGEKIAWENSINNANILGAYINKNGYAAVVFSQTGYKSLVRVYTNTGEELFTNYLVSTYALDIAISNDNKDMAIAEIDTNGINVESKIKIVNLKDISEKNVKNYELDSNEVISDIEYTDDGSLFIMTDKAIKQLKNGNIDIIADYQKENIISANISNKKNAVTVKSVTNGLFNTKYMISIYTDKGQKTYELKDAPNSIKCMNNVIAINTGSEIIFLNSSGNFMKRCEYKGQLKDVTLFNNGNIAVLIFRDYAEFIKVGGI